MKQAPKSLSIPLALALAALAGLGTALAGGPGQGWGHPGHRPGDHRGGPGPHGEGMMELLSQLNLSDSQKTKIKSILDDEHGRMQPLAEANRQARQGVEEAIHAPAFDEPAIRAAAAQGAATEADLAVERGRMVSRIRGVLTPDQQKQLETLDKQMIQKMQERHGLQHPDSGDESPDPDDAPAP